MAPPAAHTGPGDVSVANPTSGPSATLAKPTNTADGDLLVCFYFHHQAGGTLSPPDGSWTSFGVTGSVVGTVDGWWKPIPTVSSEPADYTFTRTTGSDRQVAIMFRVTGFDADGPVDAVGALAVTGTSSVVDQAVTALTAETLLLAWWESSIGSGTPSTVTEPGGMTQVGTVGVTSGSSSTMTVAAEQLTTAGSTGSRTATVSPSGSSATGFMVTIAAPVTGAADLAQDAAMSATAADIPEGSADLTQAAALTAAGAVPDPDLAGAAALTQRAALVVADPGQPRTLADGVWQPYYSHRLTGGAWTEEDA